MQLDGLMYMTAPHDEAVMTYRLGYAQTRNSLFKHELQSRVMKIDIVLLCHVFLQISKKGMHGNHAHPLVYRSISV